MGTSKNKSLEVMTAKLFEERLRPYSESFHPVVPFTGNEKLLRLDFTAANTELDGATLADTTLFTDYVNRQLQKAGALYGIGGYIEHRTIYERSRVFDAPDGSEPRRL